MEVRVFSEECVASTSIRNLRKTAMKEYLPHELRVVQEREALQLKVQALSSFLETDTFKSLDLKNRTLLRRQLVAMETYLSILDERITLFAA